MWASSVKTPQPKSGFWAIASITDDHIIVRPEKVTSRFAIEAMSPLIVSEELMSTITKKAPTMTPARRYGLKMNLARVSAISMPKTNNTMTISDVADLPRIKLRIMAAIKTTDLSRLPV